MRIANFQVNQEQVVWWSQSYVAWLDNNQLLSPVRAQLPKVDKTADMDDFEEINQDRVDGNNSVELSVDIPGQE